MQARPAVPVLTGGRWLGRMQHQMLKSLSERDFSVLLALPTGQEHHVMSNTHVMMPLASPLPWLEPILVAELLAEKITGIPTDDAQAQESEAGLSPLRPCLSARPACTGHGSLRASAAGAQARARQVQRAHPLPALP